MNELIFLPKPEELAYNLDRLPQNPNEYISAMKSLAESVRDYSKQIAQIFEQIQIESAEINEEDEIKS